MGKISKRYAESAKLVDKTKEYGAKEAIEIIEKCQKLNLTKLSNYM